MTPSSRSLLGRIAVVAIFALLTLAVFHWSGSVDSPTEGGVTMFLPVEIGGFTGKLQPNSEGEMTVLPKDTEIIKKAYTDTAGDMVTAQIVLSGAQKRSIHRPELCLPAQGWSISNRQVMPVTLADGRRIEVMKVLISRPVTVGPGVTRPLNSIFCYWFVGKDVSTPSHLMRLLLTSWDRVVHKLNHRWAYIAVSAPVLEGFQFGGKNGEETEKMLSAFISDMGPRIMKKPEAEDQTSEARK